MNTVKSGEKHRGHRWDTLIRLRKLIVGLGPKGRGYWTEYVRRRKEN